MAIALVLIITPTAASPECVYLTDPANHQLVVWEDGTETDRIDVGFSPTNLLVRGDEAAVTVRGMLTDGNQSPRTLQLVDLVERRVTSSYTVGTGPSDLVWCQGKLFLPSFFDRKLLVIEGGQVDVLAQLSSPLRIATDPDCEILYVATLDGQAFLYDMDDHALLASVDLRELGVIEEDDGFTAVASDGRDLVLAAGGSIIGANVQTILQWNIVETWRVGGTGLSNNLLIVDRTVYSATQIAGVLVEVRMDPPRREGVHEIDPDFFIEFSLRGLDVSSDGSILYVNGPRGLYEFDRESLRSTLVLEGFFVDAQVAACPGESTPTETPTPSATPSPSLTATTTPTAPATPTPTPSSTFTTVASPTPTSSPTLASAPDTGGGGSGGGCNTTPRSHSSLPALLAFLLVCARALHRPRACWRGAEREGRLE